MDGWISINAWRVVNHTRFITVLSFFVLVLLIFPSLSTAYNRAARHIYQHSIVDYRSRLNPRFQKIKRHKTRYIIVHTTELALSGTLRVVSKGKRMRNDRITKGGHTHYVIARISEVNYLTFYTPMLQRISVRRRWF
jgi:hypothetical protein